MVEPSSKKRKLEPNGTGLPSLGKQESFSAVLEQLEAEQDARGGQPCLLEIEDDD